MTNQLDPNDIPETARHIRDLRHRTGLTQAQFAAATGYAQRTIEEWERGAYTPRAGTLQGLEAITEKICQKT